MKMYRLWAWGLEMIECRVSDRELEGVAEVKEQL